MRDAHDVDVEQVLDEVRQRIAHRGATNGSAPAPPSPVVARGQAATDLSHLYAAADVQNVPFTSHRPVVGSAVVAMKKALRQLLTPILDRQVAYNTAAASAMTEMRESLAALDLRQAQTVDATGERLGALETADGALLQQMDALARALDEARGIEALLREALREVDQRQATALADLEARLRAELAAAQEAAVASVAAARAEIAAAEARIEAAREAERTAAREATEARDAAVDARLRHLDAALRGELGGLWEALGATRRESRESRERATRAERKLRRILHAMDEHATERAEPIVVPAEVAAIPRERIEPPFDYAGFEERFRGAEEDVKARQRVYVPYFAEAARVLDIGCGRGEFLESLRAAGIAGRGVDLDLDMVLLCREKGLDASEGEAFAALEAMEDGALDGIFGAQIIEHMPPPRVIELVRLCHRKLSARGVLVLETPNPKCLTIFAESFYMDPSHLHPLHPDTMQYLLDAAGFRRTALQFSAPVDPASRIPALAIDGGDVETNVEAFNRGVERVNALLFGFQDYAVIGWKGPIAGRQGVPPEGVA